VATGNPPANDRIVIPEYPFRIDACGRMLASVTVKKCAVGANLVVIDIPVGRQTKDPTLQEGRILAREFSELGERPTIKVGSTLMYGDLPVRHSTRQERGEIEALNWFFYK